MVMTNQSVKNYQNAQRFKTFPTKRRKKKHGFRARDWGNKKKSSARAIPVWGVIAAGAI